ncbi:hypothetical protein LguiA_012398 [Lonicera macranthoides]
MREKANRGGDARYRSPPQSPPRIRARNREYESDRSRRLIDRGSGSSSARRDYDGHDYDDGDRDRYRDVQSRRLSEFNHGLSRVEESTAMKFQWKHLLADPNKLSNESNDADRSLNRYVGGYIANRGSIDRNYNYNINQKNYEDVRYLEANRSGMLFEKPISVEASRVRSYSFYSPDVGVSKSSGHLDDGFALPSLDLNLSLNKDEAFDSRFQSHMDKLQVDKSTTRELHKEERNYMVYSKDGLDYNLPFSGSKATGTESLGVLKEGLSGSFKGYGLSPDMNTIPLGHDRYRKELRIKSPVELYDRGDHHHAYCSPMDEKHGDHAYLDGQRSVRGNTGTMSMDEKHGDYAYFDGQRSVRGHTGTVFEEFHGNMLTTGEKYGQQDLLRTSIVDPIVDKIEECSHKEQLREVGLWDHIPSSRGQESPNYLEARGSLHVTKQDREVSGFGRTHREYERDVYEDHVSLLSEEGHGYERGDPWTREDGCEMLPVAEYDPYSDGMDSSSSRTIPKRKRVVDEKSSMFKFGSKIPSTRKSTGRTHDHGVADGRTDEGRKPLLFSKKSRFSHSKYGKSGSSSNETIGCGIPNPDHWSSSGNGLVSITKRLGKPHSSQGRDIKKRLGPGPQDSHVSHPLGKNKSLLKNRLGPRLPNTRVSHSSLKNDKALLKKRLGPGPQKFRFSLPWLNPYPHRRFPRKIQIDGSDGDLHNEGGDGDPLEGNLIVEKAEPPECSEDFKQLVHHAFLRFVKQLNENSGQRRRHEEQGKAGTLKCSICGRSVFYAMICLYRSKEFVLPFLIQLILTYCRNQVSALTDFNSFS